uniref:1,4-alpha-D-glucan glucohydrolase n=1 Tax=Ganoderma boninense TaxID=34458 RepID=A0A5K1JTN6_9APHY|nr:Glucoamylase (EC (1,4-alpha-D-glucan glucohydrolase) (Glucan 1,4-alpha-glucosidase) [Ganoderma boninense]
MDACVVVLKLRVRLCGPQRRRWSFRQGCNTLVTFIHTFDVEAGCDAVTFQPCSDKALSNLKAYVDAFGSIHGVNSGVASTAAVATPKTPTTTETKTCCSALDLAVFAVAEQLYDALIMWDQLDGLNVTSTSLAFFQQLGSSVIIGPYDCSSSTYSTLTAAVKDFAEVFLEVNPKYTPSTGALSEQFDKSSGSPASALTAFSARSGKTYASWGAAGLTSACGGSGGGGGGGWRGAALYIFYITGSVDALQDWSPDNALILSADTYPIWNITISLPASTYIEYEDIRKYITWESDRNDSLTTPASGSYTQNDSWR